MNRLFLIVGIAILIAALVFLNQGIKKAAPTDKDLEQQQQQAVQKQEAEQKEQTSPPAKTPPAVSSTPSATLPEEDTVGDPATAAHHIQVGWIYDEANLAHPETLTGALQAVRDYVKGRSDVSAEIVDLDVPTEDRSPAAQGVMDLGVSRDGQTLYDGNPSDAPMGVIAGALTQTAHQP